MSAVKDDPDVDDLWRAWRRGLTPPPRLAVPDWADRYRFLARGAGSTSGRWRTATVEAARGPMLAVTAPGVHQVTLMVCTQLMKTAFLESVTGFFTHLDPCPILLVQPKEEAAIAFSKERIQPMIRATPVLAELIGTTKTRSAEETLTFKSFPGGFLALVGAGSPDNLARRPVRVVLADEVDKYVVTREGNPLDLARERSATYATWLAAAVCSPTEDGHSLIQSEYLESDWRRASLICPHCGHRMFPDFLGHVQPLDGESSEARLYCEACGTSWSEGERLRALATTRWHQTRPYHCCEGALRSPLEDYDRLWRSTGDEDALAQVWDWWSGPRHAVYRARCPSCGRWPVGNEHAGFQGGKLLSPWPKDAPPHLVRKWQRAQGDDDRMRVFVNTQLGLPYASRAGKETPVEALLARREVWAADVPDGVAFLTAGVDTQDDRLEIEVVGWGRDEESWSIHTEVLEGDPETPGLWARLDALLLRRWLRADGRAFVAEACCIDSGGHHTEAVYRFARARSGRRVWAIKGQSEQSGVRVPVWPPIGKATAGKKRQTRNDSGHKPTLIGTNAAKDSISARLAITVPGPGYCHFPADRDQGWFEQLTAERLRTVRRGSRSYRIWEPKPHRRNEALDCRVYAYAALCGWLARCGRLNKRAAEVGARTDGRIVLATAPDAPLVRAARAMAPAPEPPPAPAPKRKSPVRRVIRSRC